MQQLVAQISTQSMPTYSEPNLLLIFATSCGKNVWTRSESEQHHMFDGQPQEISVYEKADGTRPFEDWLSELRDRRAVARIDARVTRLQGGNPGDYKSVGTCVYELRINYGPGYRLYFAFAGDHFILLLLGGDKSSQQTDIANAIKYWEDYQRRETL